MTSDGARGGDLRQNGRMPRLRTLAPIAVLLVLAGLLAACGGGADLASDPGKVLADVNTGGSSVIALKKADDAMQKTLNAERDRLAKSNYASHEIKLASVLKAEAAAATKAPAKPAAAAGKKNQTIHLLSGGEKALTAIALVFAIFQLNPAPFCLLDEVDAPLDDSNTVRFCDLVKKMSDHTQFLFISHNKITMEMSNQLVGVTMQEQGVSRIVAVDMEAAVGMAQTE